MKIGFAFAIKPQATSTIYQPHFSKEKASPPLFEIIASFYHSIFF